jgi:hypothetical protein
VTLNCTLQGTISWKGPPKEADYSCKNQKTENIPNYLRNRLHIVGDFPNGRYNLQIQHLEARDHGLYICELRSMSDRFHLKVVGMCFCCCCFYCLLLLRSVCVFLKKGCFKINAFCAVPFIG